MTKNKGFSSLALIIIAVLVIGGVYWVWNNQLGSEASKSVPTPVTDINIEPLTPPVNSSAPVSNTQIPKPLVQTVKPPIANPIANCDSLVGTQKSICVEKLATETKNPNLCATLLNSPQAWRDSCYVTIAPVMKDYSICEKIKLGGTDINYNNYYSCRVFTSIALNDINTCRTIVNQEDLQKTEREQRAVGVDEKLIQESLVAEKEEYRSRCTLSIALRTRNVSLCNFLPEIEDDLFSKTPCIYVVQQGIADPKSCEVSNQL